MYSYLYNNNTLLGGIYDNYPYIPEFLISCYYFSVALPPEKVNVSTVAGPGTITVTWSRSPCHLSKGYTLTYTIYYCATEIATENCTGTFSSVTIFIHKLSSKKFICL